MILDAKKDNALNYRVKVYTLFSDYHVTLYKIV